MRGWTEEEKKYLSESIRKAKEIRQNYDWNWCIFYVIISFSLIMLLIRLVKAIK